MVKQVKPLEHKKEEKKEEVEKVEHYYKPVVKAKIKPVGNKFIAWLVISCICSVIGGIIGGTIFGGYYPEWIGWGALIGFLLPTGILGFIDRNF